MSSQQYECSHPHGYLPRGWRCDCCLSLTLPEGVRSDGLGCLNALVCRKCFLRTT